MNPILALIIANIIWGASSPIFKFALTNIPPFTLAFVRFFFASLLLLPFIKEIKIPELTTKEWLELLLGVFFGITVNITFFFLGLQRTESINAPIVGSSGPVLLYFLSVIFLKEKPKVKVFLGMIIALVGVMLIILSPIIFDGKRLAFGEVIGNLFFVIAMIGGVLHPLLHKNILKKIDPFLISFMAFFIGTLTFIPFMMGELNRWSFSQLNINGWTGIIFGVFFSSALAYCLFNYGLSKINAEEVGLFAYIDPVIAILIAIPLVHEYPTFHFFIGSILVFGGIFLAENRLHWHPFHRLKMNKYSNKQIIK